jgi:hypothetical protein
MVHAPPVSKLSALPAISKKHLSPHPFPVADFFARSLRQGCIAASPLHCDGLFSFPKKPLLYGAITLYRRKVMIIVSSNILFLLI